MGPLAVLILAPPASVAGTPLRVNDYAADPAKALKQPLDPNGVRK